MNYEEEEIYDEDECDDESHCMANPTRNIQQQHAKKNMTNSHPTEVADVK